MDVDVSASEIPICSTGTDLDDFGVALFFAGMGPIGRPYAELLDASTSFEHPFVVAFVRVSHPPGRRTVPKICRTLPRRPAELLW